MSEARIRGLTQSHSSIFSASPSQRINRREIPQSQSKIFEPLVTKPKPMTYAREQYHRTTISFGDESPTFHEEKPAFYDTKSSPAGKKGMQNASTKYLLGNDRSTFFKKSVDEYLGVPQKFEPKYSNDSAFERKQKDLYDGYSPGKEESPSKEETFQYSARERKTLDRVSVFDRNDYKTVDVPKENTKPPVYNPNMRKNEILGSNVFGQKKTQEYNKRPQTADRSQNDNERRKNHLYSDLFGLASANPEKAPEKLQGGRDFLSTTAKPNSSYNPREQPLKNLASSIEIGDSPSKPPRNRPKTPQTSYTPKFQESFLSASQMKQQELSTGDFSMPNKPEIHDLELSSVGAKYSAGEIKNFCGGVHVVSLVLDIDNFTGSCKGTGRLKVRTNEATDLNHIENVFKSKGISVKSYQENVGKKTNYSEISNVNWDTPYEYKRNTTTGNPTEVKMKNLESSVFGAQKQWVDRRVESVDQELKAQLQWRNTKSASRPMY